MCPTMETAKIILTTSMYFVCALHFALVRLKKLCSKVDVRFGCLVFSAKRFGRIKTRGIWLDFKLSKRYEKKMENGKERAICICISYSIGYKMNAEDKGDRFSPVITTTHTQCVSSNKIIL